MNTIMDKIRFSKTVYKVSILNPLKNFEKDTWEIEYRSDPLTGRNATVIPRLYDYWIKLMKSEGEYLRKLVLETRRRCPFCPENVSRTPKFIPEEFEEGRISNGDAIAFPNLIGHSDKSAVIVLSKDHFIPLSKITPKLIYDSLNLAIRILKRWAELYDHINYGVILFNYLPPAGSMMIHPHAQIIARDRPTTLLKMMLAESLKYFWSHGSDFWNDYVLLEKEVEDRYIGTTDNVTWIVPFAPIRGILEIQGILLNKSSPFELENRDLINISDGFCRILTYYDSLGITSYNAFILFGPFKEKTSYYSLNIRIMARSGITHINFTDAWALPYFLWDGEAIEYPEETARKLREYFRK